MEKGLVFIALLAVLIAAFPGWSIAQDQVRWSAPMNAYPKPWTPTTMPAQNNQANQYYPQWGYGYGQASYQPYGGGSYHGAQQAYPQGGFSGNPYLQQYGQ